MSGRGFAAIGLHLAKNSINVGHVLRAAGCFGAKLVAVSGGRCKGAFLTDTECVRRHTPLLWVDDLRTVIPHDCWRECAKAEETAEQYRIMLLDLVNPMSSFWDSLDRYKEPNTYAHIKALCKRLNHILSGKETP